MIDDGARRVEPAALDGAPARLQGADLDAYGIVRLVMGLHGLRRQRVVSVARRSSATSTARCSAAHRCTPGAFAADPLTLPLRIAMLITRPPVPRRAAATGASIGTLLPYLWEYKGRVLAALACAGARPRSRTSACRCS